MYKIKLRIEKKKNYLLVAVVIENGLNFVITCGGKTLMNKMTLCIIRKSYIGDNCIIRKSYLGDNCSNQLHICSQCSLTFIECLTLLKASPLCFVLSGQTTSHHWMTSPLTCTRIQKSHKSSANWNARSKKLFCVCDCVLLSRPGAVASQLGAVSWICYSDLHAHLQMQTENRCLNSKWRLRIERNAVWGVHNVGFVDELMVL